MSGISSFSQYIHGCFLIQACFLFDDNEKLIIHWVVSDTVMCCTAFHPGASCALLAFLFLPSFSFLFIPPEFPTGIKTFKQLGSRRSKIFTDLLALTF